MDFDVERIMVRDLLLDLANYEIGWAIEAAAKSLPFNRIAVLVQGSADGIEDVCAASREEIAEKVRSSARRVGELDDTAKLLSKVEPGFVPAAFIVALSNGSVDVSIVALRMDTLN